MQKHIKLLILILATQANQTFASSKKTADTNFKDARKDRQEKKNPSKNAMLRILTTFTVADTKGPGIAGAHIETRLARSKLGGKWSKKDDQAVLHASILHYAQELKGLLNTPEVTLSKDTIKILIDLKKMLNNAEPNLSDAINPASIKPPIHSRKRVSAAAQAPAYKTARQSVEPAATAAGAGDGTALQPLPYYPVYSCPVSPAATAGTGNFLGGLSGFEYTPSSFGPYYQYPVVPSAPVYCAEPRPDKLVLKSGVSFPTPDEI